MGVIGPMSLSHERVVAKPGRMTGLFYGSVMAVVVLDQITKALVAANLPLMEPVDLISWMAPVFSFTFVHNTGIAFGLFPGRGHLFLVFSIVVALGAVIFRTKVVGSEWWSHLALGLVVGGALGNIIDRLLRGYVVDFLDVNFWPFRTWPVFNLADASVVVGVGLLLLDSILLEPRRLSAAEVEGSGGLD